MIKERYVNSEVARLLKDKGFNQDYPKGDCTQYGCTQSMACDWIEEKYNISIEIFVVSIGYGISIRYALKDPNIASNAVKCKKTIAHGDNPDGSWSSKELAYNEALKYILTIMI